MGCSRNSTNRDSNHQSKIPLISFVQLGIHRHNLVPASSAKPIAEFKTTEWYYSSAWFIHYNRNTMPTSELLHAQLRHPWSLAPLFIGTVNRVGKQRPKRNMNTTEVHCTRTYVNMRIDFHIKPQLQRWVEGRTHIRISCQSAPMNERNQWFTEFGRNVLRRVHRIPIIKADGQTAQGQAHWLARDMYMGVRVRIG